LSNLCRVGDDRPDAESTTTEPIESVCCWSAIVAKLLNPTPNYTYACAALETFDDSCLQIGKNSILIPSIRILGVEFHLPDSGKLDVLFWENLCVSNAGNERPVIQTKCRETIWIVIASRGPNRETKGDMIGLADVIARDERRNGDIK